MNGIHLQKGHLVAFSQLIQEKMVSLEYSQLKLKYQYLKFSLNPFNETEDKMFKD